MSDWRDKAKRVIADHCAASYRQANAGRKNHVPYTVPQIAQALIAALDRDDEHEVKRLFEVERLGAWSLI